MSLRQKLLDTKCGFVTDADVPGLVAEDRFTQVLVRCGCGRFVCPVQDVAHFVKIIENEGSDYVRDVSIYTGR
jgi:hypothetical protein